METGQVPVLILCDGVMEFRNSWENPSLAAGSIFQPLVGHKLACLGRAPARQLEALGNAGKCEVVGHPRFDLLDQLPPLPTQTDGPFRLLVTTARTPAFTDSQRQHVVEGLCQIAQRFQRNRYVGKRPVEVTWRLPKDIEDEVGSTIAMEPRAAAPNSLHDAIDLSDAVITTPSTVYLESVLKRRPTAILDFTNSPSYLATAWKISAAGHINPVLQQLADPPAAKMLFQRNELTNQVELGVDSKQRLFALMKEMICESIEAKKTERPLQFPDRILSDPQRGIAKVDDEFDLQSLFPQSIAHQTDSVAWLQLELAQAKVALKQMPQIIHRKNNSLELLETHIEEAEERIKDGLQREKDLSSAIEQLGEDIARKTEHIEHLNEVLNSTTDQLRDSRNTIRELRIALHSRTNRFKNTVAELAAQLATLARDEELIDPTMSNFENQSTTPSANPKAETQAAVETQAAGQAAKLRLFGN